MPTTQYAYKVKDAKGKFVEGKVEAASEAAVADKLKSMGYVTLDVRPLSGGIRRDVKIGLPKRVKLKDLAI
ncbi:MAG: type secretion system protein, partial [Aeromicrobium sp.]|nr:type secretion system protein [Aeromicrobium sp.]